MKYSTVYVGMDVHKETFSLCCYTNEKEQAEYPQKVDGHYSKVINYIEAMRFHYGDDALFICGYEAGCLGFTLYHQLTDHNVKHLPRCFSKRAGRRSRLISVTPRLLPGAWRIMITHRSISRQNRMNRPRNTSA